MNAIRRRFLLVLLVLSGLAAAGSRPISAQTKISIYLANPLGFSEAGRDFIDHELVPQLTALGYNVIDPFKLTDPAEIARINSLPAEQRREAWKALDPRIARTNSNAIDRADAVLAVLDGTDVDSGTAAEIGYAFGRHKPILGYRGDFRISADNEGATVNLQVEYFIRQSGGDIVSKRSDIPIALARMLNSKH